MRLYAGTYTNLGGDGVLSYEMDGASGKLTRLHAENVYANPSYLALSSDGTRLYAACERGESAVIAAFATGSDGALRPLGEAAFPGAGTCHVCLSPDGRRAIGANFPSGDVFSVCLQEDGAVGALASHVIYEVSGSEPPRRMPSYAHCAMFLPGGKHVLAADLGSDSLWLHSYDPESGVLGQPARALRFPAGEGPRHLALDAAQGRILVNAEMGNKLYVCAWDGKQGIRIVKVLPVLSPGFAGKSSAAALKISPDGRYAAVSNRGEDSVAMFVPTEDLCERLGNFPTGGRTPRDIAFSPDGRYLVSAHQDSGTLTVCRFDGESGSLTAPVWEEPAVGAVSVLFAQ